MSRTGFPTASKILLRYEQDRAYKLHRRKVAAMKPGLDNSSPKKYPHLVFRLKQLQKEEERQSEIDHENQLLLEKMTHIMKHRGAVDNWNEYEPRRGLNTEYREKQRDAIRRENLEIVRRLDRVKPTFDLTEWDDDFRKHMYLQQLWSESVKDFGEFTPRKGYEASDYEDDFEDDATTVKSADKLPRIRENKDRGSRSWKSDSQVAKLPNLSRSQKNATTSEEPKAWPKGAHGPEPDINLLFRAAKQMARADDVMIKTLARKTYRQRMQSKQKFKEHYGLDLVDELKNGLGEDWHVLIEGFLKERLQSDTTLLRDALKNGENTTAVEMICTRSSNLQEFKESYRKEFAVGLESDIKDYIKEPVQMLLLCLQKGRKQQITKVDQAEAEKDAEILHESGDGRWTSENGKFVKLLTEKGLLHTKAVLLAYKQGYGTDAIKDIQDECPKDYADACITLINCMKGPHSHIADKLHTHMHPTDAVLVDILVTKVIDMGNIKKAYKRRYAVELTDDIKQKCAHHPTKRVLVELASRDTTTGNKQSTSKGSHGSTRGEDTEQTDMDKPEKQNKNMKIKGSSNTDLQKAKQNGNSSPTRPAKQNVAGKQSKNSNGNGTVKTVTSFNPEEDCDRLKKAVFGVGTDEETIIEILTNRSNQQRQQIKATYMEKFNQDLSDELCSELSGHFEEIVLSLLMTPTEYDAHCLHEGIDGLGTNEAVLIGILCTRTSKEMNAIKERYKTAYNKDLESDIRSDTSSGFAEMLLELCLAEREQSAVVNRKEAQEDAKQLYMDGQRSLDPKDETFRNVLVRKSRPQVKATFEEYKQVSGNDIQKAIVNIMLGDTQDGYLGLADALEDVVKFYTERIHSCFADIGTNTKMLIRIVVSRAEIDLQDIKTCYKANYGKTLYETIENECKEDYAKMLLAIVGKN